MDLALLISPNQFDVSHTHRERERGARSKQRHVHHESRHRRGWLRPPARASGVRRHQGRREGPRRRRRHGRPRHLPPPAGPPPPAASFGQ
uniref:Uncharacterized protein n=1 Tax=Arundo donax TaxID=35708 RepID=A0A0A9AMB8_ARUDO